VTPLGRQPTCESSDKNFAIKRQLDRLSRWSREFVTPLRRQPTSESSDKKDGCIVVGSVQT